METLVKLKRNGKKNEFVLGESGWCVGGVLRAAHRTIEQTYRSESETAEIHYREE